VSRLFVLCLVATACGKRDQPEAKPEPPPRRVIEPPAKGVRALPPHAIRVEGIGPFKLGETVSKLLDQLPSGPRITNFSIPGLVHRDILRAEEDAILIGAEPQGKATFVAVVRGDIARTEANIHVGSTREELVRALGTPLDDPDRAQDPHIVIPTSLKNMHALTDNGQIVAIVIATEEHGKELIGETACTRPRADREKHEFGACLTGTGEIVHYEGDELSIIGKDSVKPLATVPGLVFAAALRNPSDGRDDIVAIKRASDGQTKTWSMTVFHFSGDKPVRLVDAAQVFQISAANAKWIGADLRDVDIYPELVGRADTIEVGGLLTTRVDGKIRDIVVISAVPVQRRRVKGTLREDAGTSDLQR